MEEEANGREVLFVKACQVVRGRRRSRRWKASGLINAGGGRPKATNGIPRGDLHDKVVA